MKKKKRRLLSCACAFAAVGVAALALWAAGVIGTMNTKLPPPEAASAFPEGEELPFGGEEWREVGKSEGLTLFMRTSDGNFYVETSGGERWYANPPDAMEDAWATRVYRMELASSLIVNYYDLKDKQTVKKNTEAVCVKKKSIAFYRIDGGFKAVYEFADAGISIPVEVRLEGDHLLVRIVTSEIREENGERYLLASVRLLPNFACGGAQDSGYILLPDGEGALMRLNNGKGGMSEYQAYVYGDDLATTALFRPADAYRASLPVFGVKRNEGALFTVISGGESRAKIVAVPSMSTSTYASVYAEYVLRSTDRYILDESSSLAQTITLYQQGAMETEVCEQRYYFLAGEEANFAGMAGVYRGYLMRKEGMAERKPDGTVLFLDVYAAVSRRESVLGIPVTVQRRLSDLDDVRQLYAALRGVLSDKVRLRVLSWSADGLKGKSDTSPSWAAGNRWSQWDALSEEMEQNGDAATLSTQIALFSYGGNGLIPIRDAAQTLSKSPAFQYRYLFSTRMRDTRARRSSLLHPALLGRAAERLAKSLSGRTAGSLSILTLPSARYGSYGKNFASTEQTKNAIREALSLLAEGRELVLDDMNAFALPYADYAAGLPEGSSRYDATDESVPFLQMVYGGFFEGCAGQPINLSDSPERAFLNALATGEALRFSLITGDSELLIETELNFLVSADADGWLERIAEMAQTAEAVYGITEYSRLIGYTVPAEDITVSAFENGALLCVNRTGEPYDWEGVQVAPMSCAVKGGENL